MKYAFIHDHSHIYRIATLCYVLDVSQRGFYDWRNRPDAPRTKRAPFGALQINH